ncbi:MAG: hydroxymethylbilane synthase [Lachnospiraceae bacterium]|nr:hydroxymethylbilane synthase [Lachnospiraceae bacterium]
MNKIRIGTRGSKLALKQASLVQEALQQADGLIETEVIVVHTKGDKVQDRPLSEIGDKGVFASELEQALLNGQIDIAVHSAKDLPMDLADGLSIVAVLPRGDVRDVFVIPEGGRMPLPAGSEQEAANVSDRSFVIGSGSRRRQQLASQMWENVVFENIRGNVDTRLRKLKDGSSDGIIYDGIILAKAGLDRLGISSEQEKGLEFYPLPPEQFLPAACQGIIAVEAVQDSVAAMLCRKITDSGTELCFLVEREVLVQLAADCSEAAAAWCRQEKDGLTLDAMYAGNRERLVCVTASYAGEMEEDRAEQLRAGLAMAREAAKTVAGIESS